MLVAVLLSSRVWAVDNFDLIIMNHAQCQTWIDSSIYYGDGFGIPDMAMLVNTGTEPITASDLQATHTVVTPDNPALHINFRMFVGTAMPQVAPVMPGEAVLCANVSNDTLRTLLLPGETFRATCPTSTMGCQITGLCTSGAEGPVTFEVTFGLGGKSVSFPMTFDVQKISPPEFYGRTLCWAGAIRVSSNGMVATRPTTWGRMKSLYR
jgi:hypothetical protein